MASRVIQVVLVCGPSHDDDSFSENQFEGGVYAGLYIVFEGCSEVSVLEGLKTTFFWGGYRPIYINTPYGIQRTKTKYMTNGPASIKKMGTSTCHECCLTNDGR